MNRILLRADEVTPDGVAVIGDVRAQHIREVLHATVGQPLRVGILDGPLGNATISDVTAAQVTLQCTWGETPPVPPVDLLLALPRPKVLKRLWSQLSALGVGRVLISNAARVEKSYFESHWLLPAGYLPHLVEGLQQASDTRVPQVTVSRSFRKLVEDELDLLCPDTQRLVAHPGAEQALVGAPLTGKRVLLAVGPEGGWNEFELALLAAHGFSRVGMGPRILRTDTACVALLSLVQERLTARQNAP